MYELIESIYKSGEWGSSMCCLHAGHMENNVIKTASDIETLRSWLYKYRKIDGMITETRFWMGNIHFEIKEVGKIGYFQ